MSFVNRVVLITGGSSGIGAATAILFAKKGANVAIVGRNEEKLKNVAVKIESNGKKPLVIKADISKDEEAKTIVKKTVDRFGRLDVLVNNAGFVTSGSILDGDILAAYDKAVATNLRAVICLTTWAAPYLVSAKGNIIIISSVSSNRISNLKYVAYATSKAALDHFTRGAALELAASGVRVNSVSPGPVRTDILINAGEKTSWDYFEEFTPLKRISEPEEIADLIIYLASEKARGITGSIFVADNGWLLRN